MRKGNIYNEVLKQKKKTITGYEEVQEIGNKQNTFRTEMRRDTSKSW